MFSSYRALFGRAETRPLVVASALAWLAFSGYAFAIILAVHAATSSFAVAGGTVAVFGIGSGLGAPVRGRFVDAHGPASLSLFTAAHACAGAALAGVCALRGGSFAVFVFGALAGVFAPPLLATARSVWARVAGPALAPTAHALNAAMGDGAQLLSPAFVGMLTPLVSASAALGMLLAAATVAGGLVARTGPRHATVIAHRRRGHRIWGVLEQSAGLRTLVACHVLVGLWTGAFDVTATAVAAHSGSAALGAIPLSTSAVGSLLVSLWSGTGRVRDPPARRYLAGCLVVAATLPPMLLVPSIPGIATIAVAVGAGYALLNVALFQLLDHVVAAERAVEAFTWLTTANAAGTAIGAAGAGLLAHKSATPALLLSSSSAVALAAVALARRSSLRPPHRIERLQRHHGT
jgi:Major Facilitator Superfamily